MRNLFFMLFIILINGCSILPGMENVDTTTIPIQKSHIAIPVKPLIIPITPLYLMEHKTASYVYHVAPQDVLSIVVWKHPEFDMPIQQPVEGSIGSAHTSTTAGYVVDQRGNIYFPLIGSVHVAGKSIADVRQVLVKRLQYYVPNPQIFLRVVDYRSKKVYVMGEVLKPGVLPLTDQPMSITNALNKMGSFDPNAADPRHIYVIRGSFIRPKIYWLNVTSPAVLLLGDKFYLQENDIVVISTAAVARWNRFLNQLLPTLQTIWYTKAITSNTW